MAGTSGSGVVSKETKEAGASTTSLSTGRKRKVAYFYDGTHSRQIYHIYHLHIHSIHVHCGATDYPNNERNRGNWQLLLW
jgi:hypothetical protein